MENICGKLLVFPQFPNENYIFFHNFRIKAIYISTTSESKLYIFPQLPNQSYIYIFLFYAELKQNARGVLRGGQRWSCVKNKE